MFPCAQNESLLQQLHNLERRLGHKTEELELLQEGQSMMQQQLRVRRPKPRVAVAHGSKAGGCPPRVSPLA